SKLSRDDNCPSSSARQSPCGCDGNASGGLSYENAFFSVARSIWAHVVRPVNDHESSASVEARDSSRLPFPALFFGDIPVKVMVLVKATADSEAGIMPSEQLLREMGEFNEQLVKAGIMVAGEGLKPSREGKRVRFSG